ncbi:MAG: phosphoribosylglycinamide formyltransferase [Spirochaetes bacterium]|uniref:Phosphoribosylglycinamide formyltransferase n=1 Tax=Candidatus Gallitreponema excrementavium TaxID=2840840 RepID=A0A9D9N2U5_9SPIR|nr:phosphoribosylglycinamide formyltransferase [Candidatus Gallitreponema excrementavium]
MSDILSLKKTAAAVLVSGNGTNLQALIDNQQKNSDCPYKINVVISDNPGAFALTRAEKAGIKTYVLEKGNLKGQSLRDYRTRQIMEILRKEKTDIVVLAGFLTILSESLINEFPERIINIHPALLPDFGGPGMYGHHVHEAVLASGKKESGCTVHIVDKGCDTGRVILQRKVPVMAGDTPDSLADRIHKEEYIAIVQGTELLAKGFNKV